jgi:hypothetical protein
MKDLLIALSLLYIIPRENEPADDDTPPEPTGKEKVFKQAEVDKIVVSRQKALKAQYETLESNYQSLLETSTLTATERQKLETDLENVQAALRTKEEQAAVNAKRMSEQHKKELDLALEGQRKYQQLFEQSTIERAVVDAAAKHEAYSPSQFTQILGNRVRVVEEIDQRGEKTGRMVPVVEVDGKDELGNPVKLRKTPDEVIADMKADVANFGNLFRANVAKGVGEGRTAPGGGARIDATKMTDAEYFANRQAVRQHYGIRDKRSI